MKQSRKNQPENQPSGETSHQKSRAFQTLLEQRVRDGIAFIRSRQLADGSFESLASNSPGMTEPVVRRKTTFITSLILSCLAKARPAETGTAANDSVAAAIADSGITFLLSQKSADWSWNYWLRGEKGASKKYPIPDDLDDTFNALIALSLHAPGMIDGTVLASVMKTLFCTEDRPGGPYHTWIIDRKKHPKWSDIDPVVNAAVACFLSFHDIQLPALSGAIEAMIDNVGDGESDEKLFRSRYYLSKIAILYFISRAYAGSVKKYPPERAEKVRKFILENAGRKNVLETALSLSALINFGLPREEISTLGGLTDYLLERPWKASGLYAETVPDGIPSFAGSQELTTAFCIEALSAYSSAYSNIQTENVTAAKMNDFDAADSSAVSVPVSIEAAIISGFKKQFEKQPSMNRFITAILKRVTEKDPGKQITLLPYFFRRSLRPEFARRISDELIIGLGTTNLSGWVSYRILDDFLDNEGRPELAPIAAVAMRTVAVHYVKLLPETFHPLLEKILDEMDESNSWERTRTYIPSWQESLGTVELLRSLPDFRQNDFATLYGKSLPHCLGPVAILARLGFRPGDPDVENLLGFFRHYLIVRQLNDDAHDWLEDLKRGFVNYAGAEAIRAWHITHRNESNTAIITELQTVFWNEVIPELMRELDRHTGLARQALSNISCLATTVYFESLITPLVRASREATDERAFMAQFLGHYSNSKKS